MYSIIIVKMYFTYLNHPVMFRGENNQLYRFKLVLILPRIKFPYLYPFLLIISYLNLNKQPLTNEKTMVPYHRCKLKPI